MKKLITVSMLGLSLALTGCGAANSAKGETKVEQQATSQPATPDSTTKADVDKENTTTGNTVNNQETNNTTTNMSTTDPVAGDETNTKTEATATAGTTKTDTLEELQNLVDEVVAKVEKAAPSGNKDEKLDEYFTYKNMLDDAELRLDQREDDVEHKYRQNELTRKEWRAEEKKLDELEDKLDRAEDKLEMTFGIDD